MTKQSNSSEDRVTAVVKLLWLLLVTVLASGCAWGPRFKPVTEIPAEKALIYVYRPASFDGVVMSPKIRLSLNSRVVEELDPGGYIQYFSEPGKIAVAVASSAFLYGTRAAVNVEAKAGGTYYVRVSPDTHLSIAQTSDELGASEIKNCRRITTTFE